MTTYKSEHLEKIMTLINTTNEAAAAERTTGQDKIDALTAQIEELKGNLEALPTQGKKMRMAGFAAKAREIVEEIEGLNIRIATLEVERAQLEADREERASKKFSGITLEVARLAGEGIQEAEQVAQQARQAFNELQFQAQTINTVAWGNYAQPAAEAQRRVSEAKGRLNRAIEASPVTAA